MNQRKNKDSFLDDLFHLLCVIPWWGGPFIVAFTYYFFAIISPSFFSPVPQNKFTREIYTIIKNTSVKLAPVLSFLVFVLWLVSISKRNNKISIVNDAENEIPEDLKDMAVKKNHAIQDYSWLEFEKLTGEIFKRMGYLVEQLGGAQPDGGIDLILRKEKQEIIVQCKHWKGKEVGITIIREFLGVLTSRNSKHGIIVTSGVFSKDALKFAKENSIKLIDGTEISHLIKKYQLPESTHKNLISSQLSKVIETETPKCPICQSTMLKKIAKKGNTKGSYFWGCPSYPQCNGTRAL